MKIIHEMQAVTVAAVKPTSQVSGYTIHSHGELMKNHIAASPFDLKNEIKVVMDHHGDPIIFTLGTDNNLRVIFCDPNSDSGWNELDVRKTFFSNLPKDAKLDVKSFDVCQNEKGQITVGIFLNSGNYFSVFYRLHNYPVIWGENQYQPNIENRWNSKSSTISVGDNIQNGDDKPITVLFGSPAKEFPTVIFLSEDNKISKYLEIPQGCYPTKAFVGSLNGETKIVACFGNTKQATSGFITVSLDGSQEGPYMIARSAMNVQCLPGIDGSSFLSYSTQDCGQLLKLVGSKNSRHNLFFLDDHSAISSMSLSLLNNMISAWKLDAEGYLYNTTCFTNDLSSWTPTIKMDSDIAQIAAFSNKLNNTSDLVYVKTDGSLHYLYQDSTTFLWNTQHIALPLDSKKNTNDPNQKQMVTYTSYTTEVSILENGATADQQLPMPLKDFQLSASQICYVMVNHQQHLIGPNLNVTVKTDHNGKLTIINRVDSIATPTYHIDCSEFATSVDIDPADNIHKSLHNIKSASDLLKAKSKGKDKNNGTLFPNLTPEKAGHAAKAIQKLSDTAHRLKNKSSTQANTPFVAFGMVTINGTIQYVEAEKALSHFPTGVEQGFFGHLGHLFGGILRSVEHALEKTGDWILKQVDGEIQFLIKLEGQVFKFVIDAVSKVFEVVSWMFKEYIEAPLEKLIQFIGFLFEWDDILQTQRVLEQVPHYGVQNLITGVTKAEHSIDELFDNLKDEIGGKKLAGQLKDNTNSPMSGLNKHGKSSHHNADPRSGFANHHMNSPAAKKQATTYNDNFFSDLLGKCEQDLKKLGALEWQAIKTAFETIAKDIHNKTLKESLELIIDVVADTLIDAIEDALNTIFEITKAFLNAVEAVISAPWNIPVLSELYHDATGGDLTIKSLSCLVLAFPITLEYKIVTGKAPFANAQMKNELLRYLKSGISIQNVHEGILQDETVPDEVALELNVFLGCIGVTFARFTSGGLGIIGALGDGQLPDRYKAVKFVAGVMGYSFSITNSILLATVSDKHGVGFKSVLVLGQGIWPVLSLLAIPKSNREAIAAGSVAIGALSLVLFILLFVGETQEPGEDIEEALAELLENVGLGITQTVTPLIKLLEEDEPQTIPVLLTVDILGLLATVFTNEVRGLLTYADKKLFSPM